MILLALALLAAPQQDDAARLYRFKVGTEWVCSNKSGNKEIMTKTAVTESVPASVLTESRHFENGKELGEKSSQTWSEKDGFVMLDQVSVYKAGSRKGDAWSYQVPQDKFTATPLGTEPVTVGAGSYPNALRLQHKADNGSMESDVWIVPGVGIVKSETRFPNKTVMSIELKEFKGGPVALTPTPEARIPDNEIDDRFYKVKMQVAEVYLRDGKKEKAAEVLEDLIKSYPKHSKIPDARRLLEEARKK